MMKFNQNTNYFLVDNLPKVDYNDFYELMREFYKNTRNIEFFDPKLGLTNKKWSEFYEKNTLFLLIKIMSVDIRGLFYRKEKIIRYWNRYDINKKSSLLFDIFEMLLFILENGSITYKIKSSDNELFSGVSLSIIEKVRVIINQTDSKDLNILLGFFKEEKDFSIQLMKLWGIKKSYTVNGQSCKNAFHNVVAHLLLGLQGIQKYCRNLDYEKFVKTKNYPPHIGLLFGFFKSYQNVQAKINKLPKRHLDYYYQHILKQKKRKAIADSVYVFFKPTPNVKGAIILKNSLLNAGEKDSGESINFKLQRDVTLQSTEIVALKKVVYKSEKSILPLSKDNLITSLASENINLTDEKLNNNHWDLFSIKQTEDHIGFGWALASPFFKSSALTRKKYTITFTFEEDSVKEFREKLEILLSKTLQTKNEISYHLFTDTILLKITTLKFWYQIKKYDLDYSLLLDKGNTISFCFELPKDAPLWTNFNKEIHEYDYDTLFPVLDFTLNENSVYYPYSLLKELTIIHIDLKVEVIDHTEPLLYNKHGKINTETPFPILGIQPLQGNSFYLGLEEWLYQPLKKLDCVIYWYDIFQPNLETYYKGYSNQELKDLNFLLNFEGETKNLYLFSLDEEGKIVSTTSFKGLKPKVKSTINLNLSNVTPNTAPDSFVNFTLVSPSVGFGKMIYMDEVLNYNQKLLLIKNKKVLPPYVRIPYTPFVKKIKISYVSTQHINLVSKDKPIFNFFHKHPLGYKKVSNQNSRKPLPLLEKEEPKSHLYIGLQSVKKNEPLSFYFNLRSRGKISDKDTVEISYLSGMSWVTIPESNILQNTTEGFTASGIFEIIIPEDMYSNHEWYDKDKDWLCFSTSSHQNCSRTCFYLVTNVGLAVRELSENDVVITPISPQTITQLHQKHQYVQQINQPFPSFGGKNKESYREMCIRTSHRLRHKNRAIRISDYIDLILDNFHEVIYIKCLTSSMYPKLVKPKEVHLVVMYEIDKNLNHIFSLTELNAKIKKFIENLAPLGVKIKVFNPSFEEVKVYLRVSLKKGVGFPKHSINKRINEYLIPWYYKRKINEPYFDDNLSVTGLIKCVSKDPSIKEVNDCRVLRIRKDDNGYFYDEYTLENELIKPSCPTAILAHSLHHRIELYSDKQEDIDVKKLSVGNMVVNQDFIIQKDLELIKSATYTKIENENIKTKKVKLKKGIKKISYDH